MSLSASKAEDVQKVDDLWLGAAYLPDLELKQAEGSDLMGSTGALTPAADQWQQGEPIGH